MKAILPILAIVLCFGCASEKPVTDAPSDKHPETAKAVVIDVRTPTEYATGHVRGSTNIPLSELPTRIAQVAPEKSTPLMVHCQSGGRSARAKATLDKLGYTNTTDLGSLANARQTIEGK